MNENQSRKNKNNQKNKTVNWWKWAFLALITLIILLFISLIVAIRPVSVNEPNMETVENSEDELVLEASLTKSDTESFLNTYLATVSDEGMNYTVQLTNQLEVNGDVPVFGFTIPFTLTFDPYVLENGNIQLRADSLDLASFSLPVSTVMNLIVDQLEIPDFIAFDSEEQMIVVNLNELRETTMIGITLEKIDLENDDIQLNVHVSERIISDQLNRLTIEDEKELNN